MTLITIADGWRADKVEVASRRHAFGRAEKFLGGNVETAVLFERGAVAAIYELQANGYVGRTWPEVDWRAEWGREAMVAI